MSAIALTVISFIVVIFVVIMAHELGHFMAARLSGIRVETFSIGFGPAIWSRKRGDTEYRLAWIPVGGYVKMAGMIDESLEGEGGITGAHDEFMSKRTLQKAFVILAGVIMNGILAFLIYASVAGIWGAYEAEPEAVIGGLHPDYPAAQAGLKPGDRILAVDGLAVESWEAMALKIHDYPGRPIELVAERRGDTLSVELVPLTVVQPGLGEIGLVGIEPNYVLRPVSALGEMVRIGVLETMAGIRLAWRTIASFVSGEATLRDIGGPIFIAQLSGESARSGLFSFLRFIAFISINIAFINILPIPVLDGGHLVYVMIESAIRRPIPTRVKLWTQQAGMILLLVLMVFIMRNDILRIFEGPAGRSEVEQSESGSGEGEVQGSGSPEGLSGDGGR